MKKSFLLWTILISFFFVSCTKSMADENEFPYNNYHKRAVGQSAKDLLTDEAYGALNIEILYMEGYEPQEDAVASLKKFLTTHLHKPDGIHIITSEIPAAKDSVLTVEAVKRIETAYRTSYASPNTLSVYVLFTNGYAINQAELGYAYRNTSVVLFGKQLAENADGFKKPSRAELEARVLQHEFGHLLGLVNIGSHPHANHQDVDNGNHCTNQRCLMYYLTDTENYPSFLLRKEPPKLDAHCLEDLKAAGGK